MPTGSLGVPRTGPVAQPCAWAPALGVGGWGGAPWTCFSDVAQAPREFSTAEVVFMWLVWSISPCSHLQDLPQEDWGQGSGLCQGWFTL